MAALTLNVERHSWLTSEFLETILKLSENQKNVKVVDFTLHDAVAKGENLLSYLIRVTANYIEENGLNSKKKSFVIKTALESDGMHEMLKKARIFDKETAFYRDIQPKFTKYLDTFDRNFKCAPRCFAANENPLYTALEDLKEQNYRNMDRHIGLDFNASAMVLRKLAKMHAITAMIYEEDPELFESHKTRIVSSENLDLLSGFTSGIRDCQQICLKWPGYEHFYDKFQYWLDNTVEIIRLTYDKDDSTFNTLTHGDLWVNNIMFKFDEKNTPVDVLLIDYQLGYFGPPALDLSYLFFTSTMNVIFEEDWDRLLQIYHEELVNILRLLKYPKIIPSLNELHIQMFKKSICSAILSLAIIPPRHMDNGEEAGLDLMLSHSEDKLKIRYAVYDKPVVYERLQYLLDYYDRKGFFEAYSTRVL